MAISGISSFSALRAPALQPADAPRGVLRRPKQADDDSQDRLELSPEGRAELSSSQELTPEQQKQVEKLKARDAEVRQHEAAHQAAAGGLAQGGASFDYERGPDGRQYAVGGEVQIDTSAEEGDPQATIAKLQQVRAAALAPADPSGQDRAVAAQAAAQIAKAQAEKAQAGSEKPGAGRSSDADARDRRFDSSSAEEAVGALVDVAA